MLESKKEIVTTNASLMFHGDAMDRMMRFAEIMATGRSTVPRHFHGNVGDCLAVTLQAAQWGMSPHAVAQKTHIVNGLLGYEAQLINAVIIARAPVTGRPRYEWFGDWDRIAGRFKEVDSPGKEVDSKTPGGKKIVKNWSLDDEKGLGVEVWATFRGESEPRRLRLLLAQAGVRNSPLWGQDPKQQLAYLAIKRWSRLYCPDIIAGVYSPDELQVEVDPQPVDMGAADVIQPSPSADLIQRARAAAESGMALYKKFWSGATTGERKSLAGEHETLKAAAAEADNRAAHASAAGPVVTFASAIEAIERARDIDALNDAASLIISVPDLDEQAELRAEYLRKKEHIEGVQK